MQSLQELIRSGDFNGVRNAIDSQPDLITASVEEAPSAVLMAVYYGYPEIANLLRERIGELTIQEAAALGDQHELSRILAHEVASLAEYSDDGFFPLAYACHFGHSEAARILIEKGAALDQVSKNALSVTPLHAALSNGHKEIAQLLIERGADVNRTQGGEGWTALHYCAYSGDRETADLILRHNGQLDLKDRNDRIPAELASERGFVELAEILRPKGG